MPHPKSHAEVGHVARRIAPWPFHKSEMQRDDEDRMISAGFDHPPEVVDGVDQRPVRCDDQFADRVITALAACRLRQGGRASVAAHTHKGRIVHAV
jgi:hypothetical protein